MQVRLQGTRPLGTVHVDQFLGHQELAAWRRYLQAVSLVVQVCEACLEHVWPAFPNHATFRVDEAGLQSEEAESSQKLDRIMPP